MGPSSNIPSAPGSASVPPAKSCELHNECHAHSPCCYGYSKVGQRLESLFFSTPSCSGPSSSLLHKQAHTASMAAVSTDPVPFSVANKTALITGAGSGINYCFAKLLLSKNCNVVIADLALRPEAQKLIDEHTSNPKAIFVKTDVTMWDQLSHMFDVAERQLNGVDIVCPGAGVFEPHWTNFWIPPGTGASKDSPTGGPDGVGHYSVFDINLVHPVRTTQLAISRWLNPPDPKDKVSTANPKRIVHISSIAGQTPSTGFPLYIASKHALSGFIRSMAPLDSTMGIRINGVAPGIIKTPLWTEHPEKLQVIDEESDTWVSPEEVAEQMLACVEDDKIGGGTVWEVLKGKYRVVDWKMDPGPQGPGASVGHGKKLVEEVMGWLGEDGWGVPKK